ncbi:MAG: cbb3-type cytochrome c oxidase subunit I [Armatimonadetes bacterium]|nr:cbb3-type cytochrome c oxidase subunit I [Armatimonadota bacterium]
MRASTVKNPAAEAPKPESNYLNNGHTIASWLLTKDHKRIAILYLISVTIFFAVGSFLAGLIRAELILPRGVMLENETYNKIFTLHGVVMIFFFLIPSIPATLGNFLIPMMIGAKDLAFPRLNLLSWYLYIIAGLIAIVAIAMGGVDTGWTFYAPYASMYSNSQVSLTIGAAFLAGFSSIFTGINFIVTIHKMRAPGMTWFRLPLYVWGHYSTSIIIILGTPVVAITLLMLLAERTLHLGFFSPELGGDPVLFQHLFWFYSHPAVYIMILPGMGVISEIITCFSRRRIFGYEFVAFSSLAIAGLGFLVWGHHLYVSGQSMYQGMVFSIITFLVAIPSAVKVFNWSTTIFKGSVRLQTPMAYALGFMGLFLVGGLTGLYLSSMATDIHLTDTYFVVAHFHFVMVGGAVMAMLGGVHFWWPKMTGKMYNEHLGKLSAAITFVGFNLTFLPQFAMGYLGMPRRYHYYYLWPDFQIYHILSTAGAFVLAIGYAMPAFYLLWSLKHGKDAGPNPWGAKGLEWTTPSPPPTENFTTIPIVTEEAYNYDPELAEREETLADMLEHDYSPEGAGN